MAEHHYHETREVRPESSGISTGTIAFIVGGLVVAVGLIFFWVFGGSDMETAVPNGGSDIEINATSDSAAGAASDDAADTDAAATAGSGAADGAAAESDAAATVGTDSN